MSDSRNFDPKHRIIGAVIVVSLAVIFVPMILDRREAPAELTSVDKVSAPAAEAGERKVVVTPVRPELPRATPRAEKSSTAPSPSASPAPPAAVARAPVKPAEPKSTVKNGWVVQVGTFTNSTNATRLEEQLKKHGHTVRVERVALDRGNAVRLRVGPFRDKPLAVKAQGQIQKQVGVQGVVLAYP